MMRRVLATSLLCIACAHTQVTLYTDQNPFFQTFNGKTQTTPALPTYTAASAFDPTNLVAPPAPSPPIQTQFPVQLFSGGMANLSIPQSGAFVGFSVELSVANQVFGSNGTHIDPTFLNLLANIKARAGYSVIRIGGNTQEKAVFFPEGLPDGKTIVKTSVDVNNPTDTPTIDVGVDLLFAMANISSLVNSHWYIGLPFNDTSNPRLGIAEAGEQILSQYLLGFQLANEPDLYGDHGLRPPDYAPSDFINDYTVFMQAIQNDSNIKNKSNIIGPSVCCNWTPEQVFDAGFLDQFGNDLAYIAVEHYAGTRCPDGHGVVTQSQDIIASYLSHDISTSIPQIYGNTANIAQQHQKPLIMMETNTASCGGFPGLSDSFGAALFGIDWSLQMAFANFSGAMMHLGGQNVYYNPFTPPPGSLAGKAGWTIGPMYYASLIVAEAFGPSNNSRIVDLFMNGNNPLTPGYAIYENGNPTKVALINFIDDASGANNYTANISIGGSGAGQPNGNPPQVSVKYFTAPSVTTKYNFQWAGQTFGDVLSSNGILQGQQNITTIPCQSDNVCPVPVPAPGFALVFLSQDALQESSPGPDAVTPFSTTVTTAIGQNTATINAQVLATSNGYGGAMNQIGSTSFDSEHNVAVGLWKGYEHFVTIICLVLGAWMVKT